MHSLASVMPVVTISSQSPESPLHVQSKRPLQHTTFLVLWSSWELLVGLLLSVLPKPTLRALGEEGGMGKKIMLDAGAYKDMDGCVMCHPAPGPNATSSLSSTLAIQRMVVKYKGRR